MVTSYFRPIVSEGEGLPLAGGPLRFARVGVRRRGGREALVAAGAIPAGALDRLMAPRPVLAGLAMDQAHVMGVLNVTPDSFSDGGRHGGAEAAAAARAMVAAGAAIVDIGAESTRPGAAEVDLATERARLAPLLAGLAGVRWSIDTRKAAVMADALAAGAAIVNDVSGLRHDAAALALLAGSDCPVVVMHALGTPADMQADPRYDDALLDVFDWLAARIEALAAAGIARHRLIADPGIGFGKTIDHNLAILRGLTLFHGLGVPLLLGASRKALIERIAGPAPPDRRLGGSIALALHGAAAGVQLLRVHDVAETVQALAVQQSLRGAGV